MIAAYRMCYLRAAIYVTVVLAAALAADGADSIVHTRHNLSVTGQGPIKAPSERSVCVFCHASHSGSGEAPLWNRYSSGVTYVPYDSSTAKADVGQPTGSSRLCLGCHDGTVALGMVRSRRVPIDFAAGMDRIPADRPSMLRTDLSDDHPVSFVYDKKLSEQSEGALRDPALLHGPVRLDRESRLQCTSCHDAHDDTFGMFLVMDNRRSALCVSCHSPPGWDESSHRNSDAKWDGRGQDPWQGAAHKNVAEAGCENCHTPHSATSKQRLLKFGPEEENCLVCHSGNVAGRNIAAAVRKTSAHPVTALSGVHDPAEDPATVRRHVECADCHSPHAADDRAAIAPYASGALAGVEGVRLDGSRIQPVTYEYELCFMCHADRADRRAARVNRVLPQTNTRFEFDLANPSFHPVAGEGRSDDVPSLIEPYRETSIIYCSDCHSDDDGGSQAAGPHGSRWSPILQRRMDLTDFSNESSATYALCYKCHSRSSILADESFPLHKLHVKDERTSCVTCHDPHGSQEYSHLINFGSDYVKANASGVLSFEDRGNHSGTCSLVCHGKEHDNASY